ncbi:ABC transporter ATP-binding protein [Candidatus Saccharibacteria bacterium]|nr:ABC transporter ATP-binding protein [Candidatus Saccharibacteria bacterium]
MTEKPATATPTLSIKNLSKSFAKNKVIKDISFDVPEGSIFGFIGANGAGKTTTMKMILGLLPPDAGEIYVCGERVHFGATSTNRFIGYLPDVPEFYNYLRPAEYLELCGKIAGLPADKITRRTRELLSLVGLSKANKKIGSFSRGMKQRLGVAQALLGEPKLLICDEPTSALDPSGRQEILDIFRELKGRTTIIFSTHILSDVERVCDRVVAINHGKIALESTIADLKQKHKKSKSLTIEFKREVDPDAVLAALRDHNLAPAGYESAELSIEHLFLEATR